MKASRIADSVSELSQSRRAGLPTEPASSWMYRKISSPSRPASVAQISSSASRKSCLITPNCLREPPSSINLSPNRSGTIGSEASDHFFKAGS